jgi:hypothetical protein
VQVMVDKGTGLNTFEQSLTADIHPLPRTATPREPIRHVPTSAARSAARLLTSIRRFKLRTHQPPASSPGTHALNNAPLSADLKSAESAGEEIGVLKWI